MVKLTSAYTLWHLEVTQGDLVSPRPNVVPRPDTRLIHCLLPPLHSLLSVFLIFSCVLDTLYCSETTPFLYQLNRILSKASEARKWIIPALLRCSSVRRTAVLLGMTF